MANRRIFLALAVSVPLGLATVMSWPTLIGRGHAREGLSLGLRPPCGLSTKRNPQNSVPTGEPYALVVVLHGVAPANAAWARDQLSITPSHLRSDLQYLVENHWQTLTPQELYLYMEGRRTLHYPSILFTFDDGLTGVYRYAFPIFRAFHMKFTAFIIASRTEERRPLSGPHQAYMTWPELRTLVRSGLVSVQAHTFDLHHVDSVHPGLRGPAVYPQYFPDRHRYESNGEYQRRLEFDFATQRRLFEQEMGYVPRFLAWPFGASTPLAISVARRYGIRGFFTVNGGFAVPGGSILSIPRIGMSRMSETMAVTAGFWQKTAALSLSGVDGPVESLSWRAAQPTPPSWLAAASDCDGVYLRRIEADSALREHPIGRMARAPHMRGALEVRKPPATP